MPELPQSIFNNPGLNFEQIAVRMGFEETKSAIKTIAHFCQRWKVQQFYLFGSVLRDDFQPRSDIDVMVKFSNDAHWGWDIVTMNEELEAIFQRQVDLVTWKGIKRSENWIRRERILGSAKLIYEQR